MPRHGGQGVLETIALGDEHLQHLATAGQERVEGMGRVIGQRARGRANALGEQGQDVGIDPIGLGELAGGPGKVPDLARVGDNQRQPGRRQGRHRGTLVSAGGLEDEERWGVAAQPLDERLEARRIIGDSPALS
jgi:hypothetical protein